MMERDEERKLVLFLSILMLLGGGGGCMELLPSQQSNIWRDARLA